MYRCICGTEEEKYINENSTKEQLKLFLLWMLFLGGVSGFVGLPFGLAIGYGLKVVGTCASIGMFLSGIGLGIQLGDDKGIAVTAHMSLARRFRKLQEKKRLAELEEQKVDQLIEAHRR
jgi:hypothetical protein